MPRPTLYPIILRKNCIFPLHAALFSSFVSMPATFGLPVATIVTLWTGWRWLFKGANSCPFLPVSTTILPRVSMGTQRIDHSSRRVAYLIEDLQHTPRACLPSSSAIPTAFATSLPPLPVTRLFPFFSCTRESRPPLSIIDAIWQKHVCLRVRGLTNSSPIYHYHHHHRRRAVHRLRRGTDDAVDVQQQRGITIMLQLQQQ